LESGSADAQIVASADAGSFKLCTAWLHPRPSYALIASPRNSPKVLKAVRAAEQRCEMGRIDKNDITGSVFVRRHPEQTVELLVACLGEGIWRAEVYKFLLDLTDGVGWPFEVMARLIARPR
jgi:hypothetical protein